MQIDNYGREPAKHAQEAYDARDAQTRKAIARQAAEDAELPRCTMCRRLLRRHDAAVYAADIVKELTGVEIPEEKAWYCLDCWDERTLVIVNDYI